LAPPAAGLHSLWSKCVLENIVYVYRQGNASVYKAGPLNSFVFTAFVPTSLNMAGQLGIFKAGGRLGFWDSENSTAWSELGNPENATADPKTLAGATIFQDIVGRIVIVLQHGNGFIIYCTKSIVLVVRNVSSPLIWAGQSIFNSNGISYREEACFAEPDTKHYAFTTQGIVAIENGKAEFVIPEVGTYLKEKRQPVYTKMLNGRYLFFPILDPSYFTGIVHLTSEEFAAISQTWPGASYSYQNPGESVCKTYNAIDGQSREIAMFNANAWTQCGQAVANGVVRKYRDNLSTTISVANLATFQASGIDTAFNTNGNITGIAAPDIYVLPNILLQIPGTFDDIIYQEDNTNNFYKKQEMLWTWENKFSESWIASIKDNLPQVRQATVYSVVNTTQIHTYGPYVLPSFESETNRYYGKATKSQWLQRSLTTKMTIQVIERNETQVNPFDGAAAATWTNTTPGGEPAATSYNGAVTNNNAYVDNAVTQTLIAFPTYFVFSDITTHSASDFMRVVQIYAPVGGLQFTITGMYVASGTPPALGFTPSYGRTQIVSLSNINYESVAPCVYKQLGFTDIIGHGKFNANCEFTLTDSTPEAADYTDICVATPNPPKRKNPTFIDFITNWVDMLCVQRSTTINSVTFTYPDITITIPGGTIFLQEGSIEPVYPIFLGAFVYDTQYKKWGKMKQSYKQLLDYFPINNIAGDLPIPYDTFLPKAAAILESGSIALFDQFPTDSRIIFGKVGMSRKGFTDCQEVRIQNRSPLSGSITVEGSLDGKNVESSITQTQSFAVATQVTANFGLSARWYNIIIEGNYDITAMEMRSTKKGKR